MLQGIQASSESRRSLSRSSSSAMVSSRDRLKWMSAGSSGVTFRLSSIRRNVRRRVSISVGRRGTLVLF